MRRRAPSATTSPAICEFTLRSNRMHAAFAPNHSNGLRTSKSTSASTRRSTTPPISTRKPQSRTTAARVASRRASVHVLASAAASRAARGRVFRTADTTSAPRLARLPALQTRLFIRRRQSIPTARYRTQPNFLPAPTPSISILLSITTCHFISKPAVARPSLSHTAARVDKASTRTYNSLAALADIRT